MSFTSLLANMYKGGEDENARKKARYSQLESSEENSNIQLERSRVNSEENTDQNQPPHFLIIGAQKAGTMAAVTNLNKHPDIFVEKEVHYFDVHWHLKSPAWYRSKFDVSNKKVKGEKTPELIYVDECAERIKQVCPNAKFILILRDPIARAYSSWNMNTSKGRETEPFDECVNRNLENLNEERAYGTAEYHYVQRGFYCDQIERFLRTFPNRDNLLILISERLKTHPNEEHDRIFKFLGVPPCQIDAEYDHIGNYSTIIGNKVEEKLRKIYKPHNERLFKFLGYRIPEWETNFVSPLDGTTYRQSGAPQSGQKCDEVADVLAKLEASGTSNSCSSGVGGSSYILPKKATTSLVVVTKDNIQPPCIASSGDFSTLGRRHDTDKITHHGYHRYYPRYLEHYRNLTLQATTNNSNSSSGGASSKNSTTSSTAHMLGMLEIGVDQSHSLHTWLDYFPHAFVYGIDITVSAEGSRYKILACDQSKMNEVQRVVERSIKHPLFFIIDDGSHVPEHQIKCFDYLFDVALLPGGTYIIEDIETSYWTRNNIYGYQTHYGYHHERSAIEIFKDLLDDINREFLTSYNKGVQEKRVGLDISLKTRLEISTISFGQNCIIITKKTPEEKRAYDERGYRFKYNL